jgi:hypothetical protein
VPVSSIIKNNNQSFVLTKDSNGQIFQTNVTTGNTDLNGNIEILSGLQQGQMVAAFSNQ